MKTPDDIAHEIVETHPGLYASANSRYAMFERIVAAITSERERAEKAERERDEARAEAHTNAVLMAGETGELIEATARADRIERATIERCWQIVNLAISTVGYGAGREQMIKARDDIRAFLEPKP